MSHKPKAIEQLEQAIKQPLTRLDHPNRWAKPRSYAVDADGNILTLNLRETGISTLTLTADFKHLQKLDLSKNQLTTLQFATELPDLELLDISYNQTDWAELHLPKGLTHLKYFYAYQSKLKNLVLESPLPNLDTLHLGKNELTNLKLPAGFKALTSVYLANNQLNTFEMRSADLQTVGRLELGENPLSSPPQYIVEGGLEALNIYWREIEEQGDTVELYEAKMIIVGEGATGKTTLFNKLQNPDIDIIKNPTPETKGINLKEGFEIKHSSLGEQVFRAHIWDFGGQELQYMTHQFFLTPRALYVLMMDGRKEAANLPYWFKIMSLLGKDESDPTDKVHLLAVFNKSANSTGTPEYQDILKYYADDFETQHFEVDLAKNDRRFKYLKDSIEDSLVSLPIVKSQLPPLWKTVREALKERSQEDNYITLKEYRKLCKDIGIVNQDAQNLLSGYLHKLGTILHFQEDAKDLMDTLYLNPQWVVSGVYTVLENVKALKAQNGRFTTQFFMKTLKQKGYAPEDAQKILQLMTKDRFDICYESSPDHYVAAQLLPLKEPSYRWHTDSGALQFRYQYPLMPKGLMSRLIVRLSESIEKNDKGEETVWEKGVVLRMNFNHQNAVCRVLLKEDDAISKGSIRQIIIEVMGDEHYRREALRRVRDEVEKIHRQWFQNIQFDEMIPCCCRECQVQTVPNQFKLSDLMKRKLKTDNYGGCSTGNDVSIVTLLEGIYTPDEVAKKEQKQSKKRELDSESLEKTAKEAAVNLTVNVNPPAQIPEKVAETPPSVSTPISTPFLETHLGKSLIKGGSIGLAVGIVAFLLAFQYSWQSGLVSGLLIFVYYFSNDPKYRFSRYAMMILGTWLVLGQLLPNIKAFFNIQSTALNGFVEIVNKNNDWLTVAALGLSGFLFWLDFQNNVKK